VNAASKGALSTLVDAPVAAFALAFNGIPKFELRKPSHDSQHAQIRWGRSEWWDFSSAIDWDLFPDWATDILLSLVDDDEETEAEEELARYAQSLAIPYPEYIRVRDLWTEQETTRNIAPPPWMDEFTGSFPVLYVTDQRLVVESPRQPRPGAQVQRSSRLAVEAASSNIAFRIRRMDSSYARTSQQSDRRLPGQIISAMTTSRDVPVRTLRRLLESVDKRREELRQVGLLDRDDEGDPEPSAEDLKRNYVRAAITAISESTLQKLEVLEDLAEQLRTLKSFLDQRFAPGKETVLNRRTGVTFQLPNGQSIKANQLSSGEQQMMVLGYELIFSAKKGTLVIVDEPELSLHILWQDLLIDTLTQMGAPRSLQFLMATHSSAVLAKHPELERSLDQ
jgi:ABC-type transport system involved in cytochrome c biogenesis ATPase subunit